MPDPANCAAAPELARIEQLVRDRRRQHVLAQPRGPHAGREPQVHEGEAIAALIADQHDVGGETEREAAAGGMTRHRGDDRNRAVEQQPGQQNVGRPHLAGGEPQQQLARRTARERVALAPTARRPAPRRRDRSSRTRLASACTIASPSAFAEPGSARVTPRDAVAGRQPDHGDSPAAKASQRRCTDGCRSMAAVISAPRCSAAGRSC